MSYLQYGIQGIPGISYVPPGVPRPPQPAPLEERMPIPGEGLKRALCYLADYGGCGYYRCMGPNFLLNLCEKAVVVESTAMIMDPRFYQSVETVKFQRQATPHQRDFIKQLVDLKKQTKNKIMYEVDDVVFIEDIPLYNKNREAFTDKVIQDSIKEMLSMMDEITVTSEYFRDYMIHKTGNKNVTALPNYLMKWWFDRYYNIGKLSKNYEQNKKRPIIAIFASGTHVDVANRTNHQDDFAPTVQHIIKTRKMFSWHFYGSYPFAVKPYINSGEMKFFPWVRLPDFPQAMANSGAQLTFASLQDNHFNRCKSNIKLIEAGAIGLPCVCPDMPTYKDAFLKYKTGDEFIDVIQSTLKNQTVYIKHCKQAREHADKFWLDDDVNLMKHHEAYFTPFGSKERKLLT